MPMEVKAMVRTMHLKESIKKIALRRKPYLSKNNNEADVITYISAEDTKSVKRIDDEIYYSFTDDEYYRVNLPDGRTGFINRLAFKED